MVERRAVQNAWRREGQCKGQGTGADAAAPTPSRHVQVSAPIPQLLGVLAAGSSQLPPFWGELLLTQKPLHLGLYKPLPLPTPRASPGQGLTRTGFRRLVLLMQDLGVGWTLVSVVYTPTPAPLWTRPRLDFPRPRPCSLSPTLHNQFSLKNTPSINYIFPNP